MRRWQNLAAPDDPGSWYDVDGFWPTKRGTYERVHFTSGTTATATGAGTVLYAFAANTVSSSVQWVVDSAKIWLYSGGTYADKTNGVTIGTYPYMCQYGNVTICAMGTANPTVGSTSGGNFAAIAGVPNCEMVAACSNAVGYFNTAAGANRVVISDVGDYTNVTTGEAFTLDLNQTPGPITAVVAFGDSFIVFKDTSITRMRYVGGAVKWATEVLHRKIGCGYAGSGFTYPEIKYGAASSQDGVLFMMGSPTDSLYVKYFWMDSSGYPVHVNPLTSVGPGAAVVGTAFIGYATGLDLFWVYGYNQNRVHFFEPSNGAWGRSTAPNTAAGFARPQMGDGYFGIPTAFYKSSANNITCHVYSGSPIAGTCYLQTSMEGKANRKTKFLCCIPLLRRRTDLGTDSAALSLTRYRELHDTSAANTDSITESTFRKRFNMAVTDNFARFKVTFTDLDVEADDFLIETVDAGRD